jgi:uroporphyrin-III C-methyltransferase
MNGTPSPDLSAPASSTVASDAQGSRRLTLVALVVAALAAAASVLLWQKLSNIQEQLARQSADTQLAATEARGNAKQAAELARDSAARVAMMDAKVAEQSLQRTQIEELMQSLSRSRDENLVVDIDAAVRLALQQSQLTGSLEPLIAALKTADQRVTRAAQPRLAPVSRAIAKDLSQIQATSVGDTPALLVRIDELLRMADELPLANAVGPAFTAGHSDALPSAEVPSSWWQRALANLKTETRSLLRVSRIEQPEAALLSPEQSFFVRENLKLRLLNARMGLLARQLESARADLVQANTSLQRYFDPRARKTQAVPRVDNTLTALATAAAGR